MELKHIIWGMAGLTAIIALFVVGVAMHSALSNEAPPAPGLSGGAPGTSAPANAAQERVLRGFDVAFWGEGRPFVRVKDRFSDEVSTVNLVSYLMFEPQYAETGYSDEGGYTMQKADPVAVENTYRLALCHEYGLFGMAPDAKEAAHLYRIAAMSGHAEAKAAAQRLGGGK
ncbi:hypothetical protein PLCT2_02172 [Planctomycetaceae bacterium]|nr:hypothetical protein PLCT2_02172 [Planctomycetaceae bacterium]